MTEGDELDYTEKVWVFRAALDRDAVAAQQSGCATVPWRGCRGGGLDGIRGILQGATRAEAASGALTRWRLCRAHQLGPADDMTAQHEPQHGGSRTDRDTEALHIQGANREEVAVYPVAGRGSGASELLTAQLVCHNDGLRR